MGEGWVAIKFNPDIAPHLVSLKNRFTTYHLEQAGALRSIYSWRMLEHLEMYRRPNGQLFWWEVSIDDFHDVMETPSSYRTNYAQARRFVIEPAVAELTEKDGWKIEWKPIKKGRKVAALRFEYCRDPQGRLF